MNTSQLNTPIDESDLIQNNQTFNNIYTTQNSEMKTYNPLV